MKRFLNHLCLFICLQHNANHIIQWNDGATSSVDYWWSAGAYPKSDADRTQMFIEINQNGHHGLFNNVPTRSVSHLFPFCQLLSTAVTCPALTAPTNGNDPSCTDATNYNSSCTFTCMDGFALSDSADLTCGGDGTSITGTWSGSAPTCDSK